ARAEPAGGRAHTQAPALLLGRRQRHGALSRPAGVRGAAALCAARHGQRARHLGGCRGELRWGRRAARRARARHDVRVDTRGDRRPGGHGPRRGPHRPAGGLAGDARGRTSLAPRHVGGRRRRVAAATLAKGPVAVILPALAAATLIVARRDLSFLHRLGVLPVLVVGGAAGALWYGVAFAREGGAFLHVVVQENLLRFVDTADAGTGHAHGITY